MANVYAISLVLTTLIIAGSVSPNDGNIKFSISPQETDQKANTGDVSDVKDTSSEEEVKEKIKENGGFHRVNARELVCDAFGKCKNRIASALEGTKETVFVKAHEKMHEIGENTKKAFGEVKDTVAGKAHEASEKAKESVGKIGNEVKEEAKGKAKDVADISDTLRGDVKRNASEDLDIVEAAVKEDAHRLKVEGKRGYQEIQRFFSHVSAYIFSSSNFRWFMGMIHLLGFTLTYGVFIWVTYISSNIMAKALPKQQFAIVQSKIYPVYFRSLSYGVATAFLGHYFSQSHPYYANGTETIQGLIFLAIFSLNMFNSLYIEPRATKAMRKRIKLEKEEGEGKDVFNIEPSTTNVNTIIDPTGITVGKTTTRETLETQQELSEGAERVKPQAERLSRRIKKLNLISSSLNGLILIGLTYHLVYLSQLVLHSSSKQL